MEDTFQYQKPVREGRNLGAMSITYRVCVGWAWHAPNKSGSLGNFWSEGWVGGRALSKPTAHTTLSPLQGKVCSYSTGSASPAFSSVAPPGRKPIKFKQGLGRRFSSNSFLTMSLIVFSNDTYYISLRNACWSECMRKGWVLQGRCFLILSFYPFNVYFQRGTLISWIWAVWVGQECLIFQTRGQQPLKPQWPVGWSVIHAHAMQTIIFQSHRILF